MKNVVIISGHSHNSLLHPFSRCQVDGLTAMNAGGITFTVTPVSCTGHRGVAISSEPTTRKTWSAAVD